MAKEEILDHFHSELSGSSEHTRQARLFYARKFLDFAQDIPLSEWNKSLVNEYLSRLKGEGYAPGTIRFVYSVVKRVFDSAKAVCEAQRTKLISEVNPNDPSAVAEILKAMSLAAPVWDMGKRSAPRVESEDMVKPATTFEDMQAMIAAAKKGLLELAEVVYLALSSIYGLRREELCRVRREHINLDNKTIYVLSVKGGERRDQLLCDEIIPYLGEYDFADGYTPFRMSSIYRRICSKSGVDIKEGVGWHAPRRYLDTVLVNLFGQLYAHIFLRWKIGSSSLMTERYFSEDPLEVDRLILTGGMEPERVHPLVPLWR